MVGINGFPPSGRSSETDLQVWGTKAIAQCSPTNSVADLASALIELRREGIPKLVGSTLWKSRTKDLRNVVKASGSEYLGLEFGWKPLISDVKDVAKSFIEFDEKIKQYERDAGRVVRRRYSFAPQLKRVVTTIHSNSSVNTNPSNVRWIDSATAGKGTVFRIRVTTVNRWFSGAFTYHLPRDYKARVGVLGLADQARQVLGLDLTPEVLWNVAPWSWAIDWFSSTGDVIHNITDWSSDGLVMKYGYVMEHSIVRDTYTYVGPTGLTAPDYIRPPNYILVTETKIRRKATPFGFGLNLSALTGRQKAILAALGMSRLK